MFSTRHFHANAIRHNENLIFEHLAIWASCSSWAKAASILRCALWIRSLTISHILTKSSIFFIIYVVYLQICPRLLKSNYLMSLGFIPKLVLRSNPFCLCSSSEHSVANHLTRPLKTRWSAKPSFAPTWTQRGFFCVHAYG